MHNSSKCAYCHKVYKKNDCLVIYKSMPTVVCNRCIKNKKLGNPHLDVAACESILGGYMVLLTCDIHGGAIPWKVGVCKECEDNVTHRAKALSYFLT